MDKWICNKCGFVTFEKPVKRVETCAKCHSGRYRLIKTCVCGKEFHPDKSTALFCSLTCARRFGKTGGRKGKHYPREQRAKIKICPVCGIEFRAVNDCKSHQQVYCSKKCWEVRAHEIRICPTCGQEVKNLDITVLESEYAFLKESIAEYNRYQEEYSKYLKYEESLNRYNEALSNQATVQKLLNKYFKYEKLYRKLVYLPEKPEEYTGQIIDIEEVNKKLEHAKERESFYKFFVPFADKIEAYFKLDNYDIDKSVFEQYNAISNKYYELNTKLENAKSTYEKLEQIQLKLDGMKAQLEDVKPLEYLVDLFQDKTLKKKIVQIIGNRLMQLVNKYAALIFNEDYHFELEWQSSQINIICKRKAGKRDLVSDVRKLSGAESRLFTLILVLSLMSFIPTAKRPNLLILDEPEANFSAETTAQFYKLVQIIEQAIESIIIITTKTDEVYAGSRCYTIIRDGSSRIVQEHPSELISKE